MALHKHMPAIYPKKAHPSLMVPEGHQTFARSSWAGPENQSLYSRRAHQSGFRDFQYTWYDIQVYFNRITLYMYLYQTYCRIFWHAAPNAIRPDQNARKKADQES